MSRLGWLIGGELVAGVAAFVWQATRPPEQAGMVHPDTGSLSDLPQGAPIVQVKLPEQVLPYAQIGKRAFEAKCAACHGPNAAGQNGVRADHWPFGNMPPIEGLTRVDVRAIVAYVRELQRANGIN